MLTVSDNCLGLQSGALNEKLVQLLERRKAKEAQTSKKLEADHNRAMQRKEKTHMEQLELMDAAHHRQAFMTFKTSAVEKPSQTCNEISQNLLSTSLSPKD